MKQNLTPWKSLLIAPLASIPMVVIAGIGSSDAGVASDLTWGVIFAITVGLPMAYLAIVIVGAPIYFILLKFGLLRPWLFCAFGALLPLILFGNSAPFRTSLMAVLAGAAVGITAYFLLPE
ncbi:hypothetical protein [Undibacterium flavidum]|uniref:Uncharacterized protein n=1 Tax=Undibacterium flavidum TaxID=2762297 RepID=A0ABR6YD35_9BURK|nr:hypothetical protein [Undibacterium flavidum]MBC3874460.1 hypothetical protein [Undibacterium flavidum]